MTHNAAIQKYIFQRLIIECVYNLKLNASNIQMAVLYITSTVIVILMSIFRYCSSGDTNFSIIDISTCGCGSSLLLVQKVSCANFSS